MDSTKETLQHIHRVRALLEYCVNCLLTRGINHDRSKLKEPEKSLFDKYTGKLKNCTYGSQEYYEYLEGLKEALDHHYKHNSHHPEHYENGIDGFDLFDLIEMFMDWKAATERHNDGDIYKSIETNKERFGISEQITNIFYNTAKRLNW